jgi:hypothetical protein
VAGSGGACGPWREALVGAELAEQFGGGLVGDAEAGAERVGGDRLPVLVPGRHLAGAGGAGGELPPLFTTAVAAFRVAESQAPSGGS